MVVGLLGANCLDALSIRVEQFFQQCCQAFETFEKMKLRNHLHSAISPAFPSKSVYVVSVFLSFYG